MTNTIQTQACKLAHQHYENFPVAPIFLPKNFRKPVSMIYAFARMADDFADEGDFSNTQRLDKLNNFDDQLVKIINDQDTNDPFFLAFKNTINKYNLPILQLRKLLIAFKQDVTKLRYNNFAEILDYCSNSADPIGNLLLNLNNSNTQENIYYSNNICTALQLINFLQDLKSDIITRNRLYLPLDLLAKYNLTPDNLFNPNYTNNLKSVLKNYLAKINKLLDNGRPLQQHLTGKFRLYIKLVIACADVMCAKLAKRNETNTINDLYYRPKLGLIDLPHILIKLT